MPRSISILLLIAGRTCRHTLYLSRPISHATNTLAREYPFLNGRIRNRNTLGFRLLEPCRKTILHVRELLSLTCVVCYCAARLFIAEKFRFVLRQEPPALSGGAA